MNKREHYGARVRNDIVNDGTYTVSGPDRASKH